MEIAGNGRRPESTEDIRNARCLEKALLRRRIRLLREQVLAREKEQWDAALCRRFFQLFQLLEREKGAQGLGLSGPVQGEGAGGGRLKGAGGLCVYLYLDIRNEAGTMPIIRALWERHIRTAVPRVEGNELQFYVIESIDQLAPGHMGIREPVDGLERAEDRQALVVVPGVAFDRHGSRLGYGGGFYARFFAREPEHRKLALAYGFQMMEAVPCEPWDQRMDVIVTPEQVWGIEGSKII